MIFVETKCLLTYMNFESRLKKKIKKFKYKNAPPKFVALDLKIY
jgi:hypothetical protein